ncbi:MAG: GNAT family N-acetyltransferase [Eubacteriales bacterium]|nr:GNAT family N-acetyltransferase [Eubacteriales bacterium]
MRRMPAYRPELELTVIDPEGKPAGIAIIWYDPSIPYCELEPLGVVWWHRRKGLARALLYEAANRVMRLGPSRGMLGGDQAFYTGLGFQHEASDEFWQWRRKVR